MDIPDQPNRFVLTLDQGTTSTRALLVNRRGEVHAIAQREHQQIFPRPGWVEHDALEILDNAITVMTEVLTGVELNANTIAGIGITNQRETVVVWDPQTGQPIHHALVWQDLRTQSAIEEHIRTSGIDALREKTGLPLSTYFSASKLAWLLDHIPNARQRAEAGELLAGTIDSWLLWNLSGGSHGGVHITDVTNASRTQLMNLRSLDWDAECLAFFNIPRAILPRIVSSSEHYAPAVKPEALSGTPLAGTLGDQQAATFGQTIFEPGIAKNTYGTGNFLLVNTGTEIVHSTAGLISTVAYQLGDSPAHYALEGSVAVTGSLVQWFRDNLRLIHDSAEIEALAQSVDDNGGVYIVPAFAGLLAPYWRPDARGIITGLTRFANAGHLARAALEATAFQTTDLVTALNHDLSTELTELRVDGGMTANTLLMQFQADILAIPVLTAQNAEATALGAAYAAGLAVGFWNDTEELRSLWSEAHRWESQMSAETRAQHQRQWKKAVERSLNWDDSAH